MHKAGILLIAHVRVSSKYQQQTLAAIYQFAPLICLTTARNWYKIGVELVSQALAGARQLV